MRSRNGACGCPEQARKGRMCGAHQRTPPAEPLCKAPAALPATAPKNKTASKDRLLLLIAGMWEAMRLPSSEHRQ